MEKIIIFGAGHDGRRLLKYIENDQVFYFVDNNEQIVGSLIKEIPVISFNELIEIHKDYLIIVASKKYQLDMVKQLQDYEINNYCTDAEYQIDNIFASIGVNCKRILLLNTHAFDNIGDHLITIAEHYFFRKYFPEYELLEITSELYNDYSKYISQYITPKDILAITGGGFLGSLWLGSGELNVRDIIERYPKNRVIILPQTLFFEENDFGRAQKEITKEIYNKHKNLIICLRDKVSFSLAENMFNEDIQKAYIPDMALLLDRSDEIYVRNGIVMCIRDDKERIISEEIVDKLYCYLEEKDENIINMTMNAEEEVSLKNRMEKINEKLAIVQRSRLVVTDRLHCMILCAISATPCIAINNVSGKVAGVYEWIKEKIPYIFFWNLIQDIEIEIDRLLEAKPSVYHKEYIEDKFFELVNAIKHMNI